MALGDEIKQKIATIEHEALLNTVRTVQSLEKKANVFFAEYGISQAQYNILIVLKIEAKPLTQVEISERLVLSRAGVTTVMDKLDKKGYITRTVAPDDRRAFHIEMTKEGKKIVDKVELEYLAQVKDIMSVFNEKECKTLIDFMERLRTKA